MKKSFALISTLLLVLMVSILSISVIETKLLRSNLNYLKYLHLQASIYMDDISSYVKVHNKAQIEEYKNNWSDTNFRIDIISKELDDSLYYYVSIATTNDTPIRLSKEILK